MQQKLALTRLWTAGEAVAAPWQMSAEVLIVFGAFALAIFYNIPLWLSLFGRVEVLNVAAVVFAANLLLLMAACNSILLSLLLLPKVGKAAFATALLLAASIGYCHHLGIVIDDEMLENLWQTNRREAAELLSPVLCLYLGVFAGLPIAVLLRLRITYAPLTVALGRRVALILLLAILSITLFYSNYRYATFFGRENRDLRMSITPYYALNSLRKFAAHSLLKPQPFIQLGADAHIDNDETQATLGIMIVGETARADHFQLNGYARPTNPELSRENLYHFPNATACGTSTAFSLPCMFSFMRAAAYDRDQALRQSNVLDVLQQVGVATIWMDNNSSCKGVCERIASENFREQIDEASPHFHGGENYDEILVDAVLKKLAQIHGNALLVLHPLGSHGPAYYRRYPLAFERFSPACLSPSPETCALDEVINSYDNTLVYTDHIIARIIRALKESDRHKNSFVMYVSDHGESLGENGVYLHGLPRAIAPREQTHVPFLVWMSKGLQQLRGVSASTASSCVNDAVSHDNIAHTLLGLFRVKTGLLDKSLDLFASVCP